MADKDRLAEEAARREEDSVDAVFGDELSEESRDVIRSLGRKGKEFADFDDSELAAAQPPSQEDCDRAAQWLQELERELKSIKEEYRGMDARERQQVDAKRALTQDASLEEVAWLKFKAYHTAMDALRAGRGEDAAGDRPGEREREAPSRAPWWAAARAALQPTLQEEARPGREAVLRAAEAALASSSSASSEDEGDEAAEPATSSALAMGSAARTAAWPALTGSTSPAESGTAAAAAAAASSSGAAARGLTLYRPDYLEELALGEQLAAQRRQRSAAFALGLAAAVGFSLLRRWLRRRRGGGGTPAGTPRQRARPVSPVAQ